MKSTGRNCRRKIELIVRKVRRIAEEEDSYSVTGWKVKVIKANRIRQNLKVKKACSDLGCLGINAISRTQDAPRQRGDSRNEQM